jgi:hypothetical protein
VRLSTWGILAAAAALAAAAVPPVSAATTGGPCRGQTTANWRMDVLLVGRQSVSRTKLVAHIQSAADGSVSGELILGRGDQRMYVDSWCRLWGEGDENVHAIGVRTLPDGARELVRIDVSTDEGVKARVRTRPELHESGHESGADHAGWQTVTGEGWLAPTRARIGATGERTRWVTR